MEEYLPLKGFEAIELEGGEGFDRKRATDPVTHCPDSKQWERHSLLNVEIKASWCREAIYVYVYGSLHKMPTPSCPQRSIISKMGESQSNFPYDGLPMQ